MSKAPKPKFPVSWPHYDGLRITTTQREDVVTVRVAVPVFTALAYRKEDADALALRRGSAEDDILESVREAIRAAYTLTPSKPG